jgi:hypothetical protein
MKPPRFEISFYHFFGELQCILTIMTQNYNYNLVINR